MMKLCFSTRGWHRSGFDDFLNNAEELGFQGIELHNPRGEAFAGHDSALREHNLPSTRRRLFEKHLLLPCLDILGDTADEPEKVLEEIRNGLKLADGLRIPCLRLKTDKTGKDAAERTEALIRRVLPEAEEMQISLLLETSGVYADSAMLSETLNRFADDRLGALWNVKDAWFLKGEAPEEVVKNLGAFIRHVHVCDARKEDGEVRMQLTGEGEVPIDQVMLALRSVNYDGFLSLVWDPSWCPELDDMEIIFSHYVSFMNQFSDPSLREHTHYHNRAHTGEFIWKKDLLIDLTFSEVLDRVVREFPDQTAFRYTTLNYTRTYAEFRDDVDEFARALVALGVKAGSHVAVWAANVPQWYIAFWATVKLGAVLVSVNTAYRSAEIEYLLRQSDTHTLIMTEGAKDTRYGEIMAELCPELSKTVPGEPLHSARLPFLRNMITVGFRMKGCLTWEEALERADTVTREQILRMAEAVSPDDVCNMQYTSGTTGFPKGVMLTHHNIVNNGKCIGDRMDLSTADRMMIQVPMFHCFGMVLAMTAAMTHAASLYPLPYFSPKPALACIGRERITAFHGVPTMFITLLEHPDFPKTDFSHMRTGIMAGSPCPIQTMRDVQEKMHMREITIVYGQTEASPGCTMSSTDDPLEVRVGTVGHPLPEIECRIVDPETGEECPDNVNGEFLARGYNVMKGYYKMPRATAEAIDAEGWLHTGDLACRTPDGNFRITGRLKDMIIRGGENIYPKELEEFIYSHPAVSDVQVVGVPDERYGEEVAACIIPKEGMLLTEEEMRRYMSENLARHKIPRYILFVDSFPMNAAGKILKYRIREDLKAKLGL